ncbi:hypothetical protein GCM10010365_58450 [Streptomyces poonensis]|uniref:Uncharacterized protein n=1 Tax=Streptomyces poonensis TaxID=68255 RepID=A0A918URZ6_9ACTN|nr:hypothetical protein GCM10010365_58450 [Streptomyces poonensis]
MRAMTVWRAGGMAYRRVAAGQGRGREPAHAAVAAQIGDEDLAAPRGAVVPEAQPVVRHAGERAAHHALGRDRGQVRVVVLHRGPPQRLFLRPLCGHTAGVRVVGEHRRFDAGEPLEVVVRPVERVVRRHIGQVPGVPPELGPVVGGEREGGPEPGAGSGRRGADATTRGPGRAPGGR